MSNSSIDNIWKIVRNIKAKLSFEKSCTYDGIYNCRQYDNEIKPQVDELQRALKINATDEFNENVTKENLNAAAEMFLYINSCSKPLKPWFIFYQDLFQNHSPDQIILTLNRIIKTNRDKKLVSISKKLLNKINSLLSLKYEEIENVIQGKNQKSNLLSEGVKFLKIIYHQFLS